MTRSRAILVFVLAASPVCGQEPVPATSALLERATDRALAYEASALQWTCDEIVRRVRYDGQGLASHESVREYALLLVPNPIERHAVEHTSALNPRGRSSGHAPIAVKGFPGVTSWLRLFHPDSRPWVLIRDVGDATRAGPQGHPFAFRGSFGLDEGDDLREWEGTAWVDPSSGDLMHLEAVPASQKERLAFLVDRRNRLAAPLIFFGFRIPIGPTAHGRRAEVSFALHEGGFWLPTTARFETFDAVTALSQRPLRAAVLSLERCRRFETEATSDERSRGETDRRQRP